MSPILSLKYVQVLRFRIFPDSLPPKPKAVMCIWEIPKISQYSVLEFCLCMASLRLSYCFSFFPERGLLSCPREDTSPGLYRPCLQVSSKENHFLRQLLHPPSQWLLSNTVIPLRIKARSLAALNFSPLSFLCRQSQKSFSPLLVTFLPTIPLSTFALPLPWSKTYSFMPSLV